MAEQSVPPEAIEAAILAAARAYCADRFDYSGPYATPTGAQEHLERDAKSMALERPLRLWIEAAAPILVAAGRAQAAADIRREAEDEAQRPHRDRTSKVIEKWLRVAAHIADGSAEEAP